MKRISVPLVLDTLFYSAAAGMLLLGILRYFRVPLGVAIAVSALTTVAVAGLVALLLGAKRRKKQLTRRQREEREALMLHLALEREERVRAALASAFEADGREIHCERDFFTADGVAAVPLFTMQPVSADEVARLLRAFGEEKFLLLCNELTPEAEKLLRSFGRSALRGDEVYRLFSRTGTTPSPLICGELPRKTVRGRLRLTFSKTNARPFFTCGFLLLFMSLFALFPVYYLVTGSVLLLVSVAVRAFGVQANAA